ncbi:hypothetical protein H310_14767 [Aphanomyces invadans]|uniref:Ion transport domain-containing protein n=1 Tax=Aphanomyces invadans TaxID=157072 RepID=A0A024T8V2_9STRA|nr:hypothetical protein H310_14767 [Aphanomyces invadans]ETV90443.1 hypothetical protein H310_14767 [Aphanomyces invadans]|eukprot:XP_008880917.1 hypothetical protein H310_14767 [Aphanomyces invadans]
MMRPEAYAEVHVESESEDSTPRVLSPTRRVNKKVDEHAQQAKVPAASSAMDNVTLPSNPPRRWRQGYQKLYETLYMTNTREGQRCNVILMVLTIVSVTVAVLDSVTEVREAFNNGLVVIEMLFTLLFSVEYALRLLCLQRPSDYATSIYGIVDMVSILPTYLAFLSDSARPLMHLLVLRIFRILRVFRILKLVRFMEAAATLMDNIHQNKRRIAVFLCAVFAMILVIGCAMYLIEGERHGFSNIPKSMYWTVVTLTTVGYGDITPKTVPGQFLATIVMFVGYGLIACPMVLTATQTQTSVSLGGMGFQVMHCPSSPACKPFMNLHQDDAKFCRKCGAKLSVFL